MQKWRRLRGRSLGWYGRARRGLRRAGLDWLLYFRWNEILRSGETWPAQATSDDNSLWIGELEPRHVAWLEALQPGRAAEFASRWAGGRRCFGAVVDEAGQRRCLSYCWIAEGPTILTGTEGCCWEIPSGIAWRFDAYSHPLALGAYPALAYRTIRRLRQQGVSAVLGQVELDNRLSRQVHRRLGAERLGWIFELHLVGLRLRWERHADGVHLRWGSSPVGVGEFLAPDRLAATPGGRMRAAG